MCQVAAGRAGARGRGPRRPGSQPPPPLPENPGILRQDVPLRLKTTTFRKTQNGPNWPHSTLTFQSQDSTDTEEDNPRRHRPGGGKLRQAPAEGCGEEGKVPQNPLFQPKNITQIQTNPIPLGPLGEGDGFISHRNNGEKSIFSRKIPPKYFFFFKGPSPKLPFFSPKSLPCHISHRAARNGLTPPPLQSTGKRKCP